MRLLLTVESDVTDSAHDVVVNYTPESRVRDLVHTLSGGSSPSSPPPGQAMATVIALPGAAELPAIAETDRLYLGERLLDPQQLIDQSPLSHGAIVAIGAPSSHRETEPAGLVEIRISSGPGAGHVYRLGIGRATIGAAPHSTIRVEALAAVEELRAIEDVVTLEVSREGEVTVVPDPRTEGLTVPVPLRREPVTEPIVLGVSTLREGKRRWWRRKRRPAEFELGERVDPTRPTPLVHLDRRPVTQPTAWLPQQTLGVGPVLLDRTEVTAPDASLSPSPASPELDYNRPPRLHPAALQTEFNLPAEPRAPDKPPFPIAMLLAPILFGVMAFAFFPGRNPAFLAMMALSPLMMLANASGSRRHQKKRYRKQKEEYHERRIALEQAALDSLVSERSRRRSSFPDPGTVLLFATGPRARLWERRAWDRDFLHLRLGTTDLPSEITIKDPERADHEGPLLWTAPDAPVTIGLGGLGVFGVAGTREECHALAMWAVAQVAALHSPSDAEVTVLLGDEPAPAWDWVKWLPHARTPEGNPRPVRLATDQDARASAISELLGLLEARKQIDRNQLPGLTKRVVVLDGAREIRMLPGMISLLKDGPAYGILLICLDRTVRELPEECRTVAQWADGLINLEINEERHIDGIRPDRVEQTWLDRLARALSPIRDVSTEDTSAALPAASRLLDVLRLDEPDAARVVAGWAGKGRTTQAVIGEGIDGPFRIDVRADGPHGLIAGTTGSGKSELLQTVIASLAVGNRPDEFNFVLVDYKGGAAFKDCNHLPHTVGMVTDLDGHLTTRALESLGAELRRREHQLADADAKDIEDYLAGRQPGDEPMPRLLIIIDEFAALVAELPDFVNGLVDVARRGRSLGVHLILATQRPAGVVNAEIKSNTNLRIALRVTDTQDSEDVIESPVAAHIAKSFPGRAYARLGHSSLAPFQSSRVGGRPQGEGGGAIQTTALDWPSLPQLGRGAVLAEEDEDVSIPTDLASLVQAINDANDQLGIPAMRKPWLPALGEQIAVDDLATAGADATGMPPIPIGLADLPHLQQQVVESWDLAAGGHLLIAGQSRAGRSNALRVIAAGIARHCSPEDVHLYGIDAGNNALLPLVALPHTGAVVTRTQVDRMYRLLDLLQRELSERQQLLARAGFADIAEQRAGVAEHERLPYLVVLLDRWEGYHQTFESVDGAILIDRMQTLLQEGVGVGLRIVLTTDRSGLIGRIGMLVEDKMALALSDPGDYSALGLKARDVPTSMPPGRAFRAAERPRELQWALLDASGVGTDQVRVIQSIGAEATERYAALPRARRPQRVDELPTMITAAEAAELEAASIARSFVPVGVGGDSLAIQGFDLEISGNGFMITGPSRSGKSTALQYMLAHAGPRKVTLFLPRRSPLLTAPPRGARVFTGAEPIEEIKEHLKSQRGTQLIAIDDFEVIGADSPLGQLLTETFAGFRDTDHLLLLAGSIDDLSSVYRGLPNDLKRARSGLVLTPRAPADGDVVNVRLPRSASGTMPPGRGVLASPAGWRWVQIPTP